MRDGLVLIVDDSSFMRRIMRAALSQVGVEQVVEAADGSEAIELYRLHHPDLVVLDINMEARDGLDVLAEIMELDRQAKVIMCTAVNHQQTMMDALDLGAMDFMVKPIQKDIFVKKVLDTLDAL